MVQQFDAHHPARVGQLPGHRPVRRARRGIAARMVVGDDGGRGGVLERMTEDLARMQERTGRRTGADLMQGEQPVAPVEEAPRGPIVYRDGFGNIVPDLDLEMREGVRRKLVSTFGRRLEYEGNFRAGTIIYIDGDTRIRFYHEMCGGEMKFSIDVPVVAHWQDATGTPLSQRDDIIAFVAQRVKQEQASSWRYEITANSIDFY